MILWIQLMFHLTNSSSSNQNKLTLPLRSTSHLCKRLLWVILKSTNWLMNSKCWKKECWLSNLQVRVHSEHEHSKLNEIEWIPLLNVFSLFDSRLCHFFTLILLRKVKSHEFGFLQSSYVLVSSNISLLNSTSSLWTLNSENGQQPWRLAQDQWRQRRNDKSTFKVNCTVQWNFIGFWLLSICGIIISLTWEICFQKINTSCNEKTLILIVQRAILKLEILIFSQNLRSGSLTLFYFSRISFKLNWVKINGRYLDVILNL